MKEKEEIFLVKGGLGVAHGRVTADTGHVNILENCGFWLCKVWHGRVTADTGRAKLLVLGGSIFFSFFSSFLDIYLQNKLKQNKIKTIKLVGWLPR